LPLLLLASQLLFILYYRLLLALLFTQASDWCFQLCAGGVNRLGFGAHLHKAALIFAGRYLLVLGDVWVVGRAT